MKKSRQKRKIALIDRSESFDEFLEKDGLPAETEDDAIKEIIATRSKWRWTRRA
jgi:hypothetical protein